MATTLIESAFTYLTESSGQQYYYTIVTNQNGVQAVREVISPRGPVTGLTQVPSFVIDAQQTSIGQIQGMLGGAATVSGNATFSAATSQLVSLPFVFSSSNYRVLLSFQQPVFCWVSGQTVQNFTINASTALTGTVGYDLFL